MAGRSGGGRNPPAWTEMEITLLVEAWREVETTTTYSSRFYERSSIDKQICARLAGHCRFPRSVAGISTQREKIRSYMRFIRAFDSKQRAVGGRTWFEMSKVERDHVQMPVKARNASRTLTQACFNTLSQMGIVDKYRKGKMASGYGETQSRKRSEAHFTEDPRYPNDSQGSKRADATVQARSLPGTRDCFLRPKEEAPDVDKDSQPLDSSRSTLCRAGWAPSEVLHLIRACGRVLKLMQIPLSTFVQEPFKLFAELYTPRNRPSVLAWRKMKRLVISYLYIRDFSKSHGPEQWFELPGSTRDAQMDWLELPDDFEDIDREVFDEIERMDCQLHGLSAPDVPSLQTGGLRLEAQSPHTDELEEGGVESDQATASEPDDHEVSPMKEDTHFVSSVVDARELSEATEDSCQYAKSLSRLVECKVPVTAGTHRDCNVFLTFMMKQQNEQFHQAMRKLRVDIEREIGRTTQMLSAVSRERFGAPQANLNTCYLLRLMEDQQQQIRTRFARFQEARNRDEVANSALLGQRFSQQNQ